MDLDALYRILQVTTQQVRKGPEVTQETAGGLQVTHVYSMPDESAIPPTARVVDVHFIQIAVHLEAAGLVKDDLVALLRTYPEPERLARGPSYIEVGGWLGDQGAALQLFALGEALGLWTVITPERLGITGAAADQLAGTGFVMLSGWQAA